MVDCIELSYQGVFHNDGIYRYLVHGVQVRIRTILRRLERCRPQYFLLPFGLLDV